MKITKVEALPIRVPLRIAFSTSLGTVPSERKHVVVVVHTDEGISGVGEAALSPPYHAESQESVLHSIKEYYGPAVVGEDPFNLESILDKAHRTLVGNPYALAAIDFALYDIMGKETGLPVCKLLGGCYQEKIPVVWVISLSANIEEITDKAVNSVRKGFKTLKIKVGVDPKRDLERLKSVRKAVGDATDIRVDANQGWTPDQAIKIIRKMERYDLQLVEQPVPGWDLDGMARVARAIDTPIMADESVFSPQTAIKIVKTEAADILNIKIMKPGGLYNSKKVAMIAEAADIPCLVGSMLETGIGTAAGAHFAAANRIVRYPSEMIGPAYFGADVVKEDMRPKEGYVEVPTKPGLGVELDQNMLKELTRYS